MQSGKKEKILMLVSTTTILLSVPPGTAWQQGQLSANKSNWIPSTRAVSTKYLVTLAVKTYSIIHKCRKTNDLATNLCHRPLSHSSSIHLTNNKTKLKKKKIHVKYRWDQFQTDFENFKKLMATQTPCQVPNHTTVLHSLSVLSGGLCLFTNCYEHYG